MRLSSSLVLTSFCLVAALPAATASSVDDCAFSESFAMRSGGLPFAGTLDEQVAASMDNVYATSDRFTINNVWRVGGHAAVKITVHDGRNTREIYYLNNDGRSYQLNLSALPATYRAQKRNMRALMREPFGPHKMLCT